MQWGWNHNPDPEKWSLKERPGWMRLKTGKPVSGLREARNSLTQRPFAAYDGSLTHVETRMDISGMRDGDIAGLAMFQDPYAFIAVKQEAGLRNIIMVNNGKLIDARPLKGNTIYFSCSASNISGSASFGYSTDNKTYLALGNELKMRFNLSVFTGNKFCLFNYSTLEQGGHVDVDWFRIIPINK